MKTLLMRGFNQNAPKVIYHASEIIHIRWATLKQAIFIVPSIILYFFSFQFYAFDKAIFIFTYMVENSAKR